MIESLLFSLSVLGAGCLKEEPYVFQQPASQYFYLKATRENTPKANQGHPTPHHLCGSRHQVPFGYHLAGGFSFILLLTAPAGGMWPGLRVSGCQREPPARPKRGGGSGLGAAPSRRWRTNGIFSAGAQGCQSNPQGTSSGEADCTVIASRKSAPALACRAHPATWAALRRRVQASGRSRVRAPGRGARAGAERAVLRCARRGGASPGASSPAARGAGAWPCSACCWSLPPSTRGRSSRRGNATPHPHPSSSLPSLARCFALPGPLWGAGGTHAPPRRGNGARRRGSLLRP